MLDLFLPVEKLKNVGARNLPRLNKLGIKTLKDLLWHFPVRYEDYTRLVPITDVQAGEKVNIQGEVMKMVTDLPFKKASRNNWAQDNRVLARRNWVY